MLTRKYPILFSAPMVRALLEGRKTQTRRVLLRPTSHFHDSYTTPSAAGGDVIWSDGKGGMQRRNGKVHCVGDRLWVRETYYQRGHWIEAAGFTKGGRPKWSFVPESDEIRFDRPEGEVRGGRHAADPGTIAWHQRLGRFMPRRYSRTTLDVTEVRVQRLRDISAEDSVAEGVYPAAVYGERVESWLPAEDLRDRFYPTAFAAYNALWDHINGPGAWDANPWVVAYTFAVYRGNIDRIANGPRCEEVVPC